MELILIPLWALGIAVFIFGTLLPLIILMMSGLNDDKLEKD